MQKILRSLVLAATCAVASAAWANPVAIPCTDCPEPRRPPVPESGIWSDPTRPGTGFTLNLQRRTLGGAYFGYAPDGHAVWYVFSGPLVRAQPGSDYAWSLDAVASEFRGGGCLDCAHAEPGPGTAIAEMRFEFLQRSLARVRVGSGQWTLIRPLTFGVSTYPEFAPEQSFPVPELKGPWALVFQDLGAQGDEASRVAYIANAEEDGSRRDDDRIGTIFIHSPSPAATIVGEIDCLRSPDGTPLCTFLSYTSRSGSVPAGGKRFVLPLGNISASRFKGEAEDGETIEGFRIDHD